MKRRILSMVLCKPAQMQIVPVLIKTGVLNASWNKWHIGGHRVIWPSGVIAWHLKRIIIV